MKLRGAVCDSMSWVMELTNLVLDEELDTLDGGGGSLGDGSGDTTHCCPMLAIVSHVFQALIGAGTRAPSMRHRGAASEVEVERTHEVNDEAGHAHELLLALAVMAVSMFPDGAHLLKLDKLDRAMAAARYSLDILGRGSNGGRHSVGCVRGYMMEWRGCWMKLDGRVEREETTL
jgi:hypothetical protein